MTMTMMTMILMILMMIILIILMMYKLIIGKAWPVPMGAATSSPGEAAGPGS